jgi:hypothetical protein
MGHLPVDQLHYTRSAERDSVEKHLHGRSGKLRPFLRPVSLIPS